MDQLARELGVDGNVVMAKLYQMGVSSAGGSTSRPLIGFDSTSGLLGIQRRREALLRLDGNPRPAEARNRGPPSKSPFRDQRGLPLSVR